MIEILRIYCLEGYIKNFGSNWSLLIHIKFSIRTWVSIQVTSKEFSLYDLPCLNFSCVSLPWCFLTNVKDPSAPQKDCFNDTKWSPSNGQFYSVEACRSKSNSTKFELTQLESTIAEPEVTEESRRISEEKCKISKTIFFLFSKQSRLIFFRCSC
jgi:hypothetical protein